MFIIVGVWGSSGNRIIAAYQLFLYTVVGGVFGLVAILAIYSQTGTTDFLVLNTYLRPDFIFRFVSLMFMFLIQTYITKIYSLDGGGGEGAPPSRLRLLYILFMYFHVKNLMALFTVFQI